MWLLGSVGATTLVQGQVLNTVWGGTITVTSLGVSMAVNALVTGLIVFKILRVFLEVQPVLDELTLNSTGGTKLRHVVFVIIESGMALFAIQAIRLVFSSLPLSEPESVVNAFGYIIGIHEMLNVIIRSIATSIFYFFCFFFILITFTRASLRQ